MEISDNKQNIISIIPARGGSKGIHNKNIIPVAGKPLIAWTIEQSKNTKEISKTYVSTNDENIAETSSKYGAEIVWRPDELCTDSATSESALQHTLDYLEVEKNITPEIIVFLQPTSPLRKNDDIDNALKFFIKNKADSLISGSILEDFLIWEKKNDKWKCVNFDYKNRGVRQDRKPQFVENGSIYIFKPEILKKYSNRIGGNLELYEMEFWQTWEIDTKEDIDLVEFYLNTKIKKNSTLKLKIDKIALIAFDFDGVFTNNKVITLQDGSEGIIANRSDGRAINGFKNLNIPMIIISTEKNPVVMARAKKIGLEVIQSVEDKKNILLNYCQMKNIMIDNVVFVGNDLNDLEVMSFVGWPICPADAHAKIKNISKIVLNKNGGDGVVRELYELMNN